MYSNLITAITYKSMEQQWVPKEEEKLMELGKPHILDDACYGKRFIDDIFVIWTGSASEFITYMNTTNQIHHTIKFT